MDHFLFISIIYDTKNYLYHYFICVLLYELPYRIFLGVCKVGQCHVIIMVNIMTYVETSLSLIIVFNKYKTVEFILLYDYVGQSRKYQLEELSLIYHRNHHCCKCSPAYRKFNLYLLLVLSVLISTMSRFQLCYFHFLYVDNYLCMIYKCPLFIFESIV